MRAQCLCRCSCKSRVAALAAEVAPNMYSKSSSERPHCLHCAVRQYSSVCLVVLRVLAVRASCVSALNHGIDAASCSQLGMDVGYARKAKKKVKTNEKTEKDRLRAETTAGSQAEEAAASAPANKSDAKASAHTEGE